VHEEVCRYLAETNCSGDEISAQAWTERVPHLDTRAATLACQQLSRINAIGHLSLDEAAEALENEQIDTDIFHMDHPVRLRFEARVAAVREYRRRMSDPGRRFESLLAAPVLQPATTAAPAAVSQSGPIIDSAWAALTAEQAAQKFTDDNPKLVASETGKREAKCTDKTNSQFESAMRRLQNVRVACQRGSAAAAQAQRQPASKPNTDCFNTIGPKRNSRFRSQLERKDWGQPPAV
jgi:hypothetical protein